MFDRMKTLAPSDTPCDERRRARRARWGIVRTTVKTSVRAPCDSVADILLDYTQWPRVFAATIAGVALVHRDASVVSVMVEHRREGRVLNVLWTCTPGVVELREFKRRFDATFVNRFEPVPDGTRYSIDAEVRFRQPYALVAPVLRLVVKHALRRYTLEPVRLAAEARGA